MKTITSQMFRGLVFAATVLVYFGILAPDVFAARFIAETPHETLAPGSEFVLAVALDTQGASLNAFEGQLLFPDTLLEAAEIRDGGSVVTVWLDTPMVRNAGRISFSGITPGGYNAERGQMFSVVFRAKEEGSGAFSFANMQALINDGSGTPVPVSGKGLEFVVSKGEPSSLPVVSDTSPPEPFVLAVAESQLAFDGKKALVFVAHDKGSGIARYEVCEGFFASCVTAESPYVLARQSADMLVRVNAFDHSGNMRTAYLYTPRTIARYILFAILAILFCVGVFFATRRFRHS